MKLINKLILAAAICKLKVKADQGIIGNLAFYGRGQRHLPNYWNDIDKTKGSVDAKVYFPYNESDENTETTENAAEETTENAENKENTTDGIVDNAKNNPLILFLPGKRSREFSRLDFFVLNDERSIDLTSFHRIKSEIKLVAPKADELISKGYTCESIGLTCSDLKSYDFDASKDEWLSKADIQLWLESKDANNEEEDKELFHYDIKTNSELSTDWSEYVGNINKADFEVNSNYIYTDLVFRNYGTMPVYVYIGNTIFLKKDPTDMVKEGTIQNNFANWSWHQNTANKTATYYGNQVYEGDPEGKQCVKFVAEEDGDFAYYVHIENGISAPPEGVSFKIRPMNDNQFKFKIDNKKEFNLTYDYLIHRNCRVPIEEETEFLVDVRSLVYSDPKFMLMNDISGFWLQTISEIKLRKQILLDEGKEQESKDYKDVLYFYDFTLHHTYPEDTSKYVREKLFEDGPECSLKLETHEDWGNPDNLNDANPVIQWPDNLSFETIFKSKNSVGGINECKFINYLFGKEDSFECCTVNGVTCDEDSYIIEIDLSKDNKSKRDGLTVDDIVNFDMPETIENMKNLKKLRLNGLGLKGKIPSDIGEFKNLQTLDLSDNQISGEIPESIVDLKSLESLNLSNNEISGEIPETIGELSNLKSLNLSENKITGDIPESIGNLANLEELSLKDNAITGDIPESIANNNKLKIEIGDSELNNNNDDSGALSNYSVMSLLSSCIVILFIGLINY